MTLTNVNLEMFYAYEKCNFLKLDFSLINAASRFCYNVAINHNTTETEKETAQHAVERYS